MAVNRNIVGAAAFGLLLVGLGAAALLPRLTASPVRITIGGPFALTDGTGRAVTDRDFRGSWLLIYFGYTHCPDACPTTLSDIAAGLDKMKGPDRARVRVLFITVDPSRDTPAVIGAYARAFGPEFVGLTGTPDQIATAEAEYHVYARRAELKGGDYAMDHSSIIYVMRPDGGFSGLLEDGLAPAEIASKLAGLGA
jgi:protein SCO1/2